MKKTTYLALILMIVNMLTAQETVTLKFTSTTPNGSYFPFDVVNVTNVTRGWTESLTYPDTTMMLTPLTGLDENLDTGGFLSEVYPNPLSGTANVMFSMNRPGTISAKILSANGCLLSEYSDFLEEGTHQISINMNEPQMAFLIVITNENQYVKKILNISYGDSNSIAINKISDKINYTKERTIGDFEIGDVMSYMAVSFANGNMIESERLTQSQFTNETITLTFTLIYPTVTTNDVSNVTTNTASCGGNVTSAGYGTINAKGVCWSTSHNPTIIESHTTDGTGTGGFTSIITDLAENTTYYVRAYATNEIGTSYGEQKSFTTLHNVVLPIVTTNEVSNITTNTATCGGNVTSSGYGNVSAKGVCWSVDHNPTIDDSHTLDGTDIGAFISNLTDLNDNTTYYVRAYATNESGTAYGTEISFTTEMESIWPNGTLPGLFSIGATIKVQFSQGNLQYKASTNTWRFANTQYDIIGEDNINISQTYEGYIDLFGWGTSGYNHGATCYQPWSYYSIPQYYYAYGDPGYHLYNMNGTADWGYNSIINGGNQENYWRTLTSGEWSYILFARETESGIRFAKATINEISLSGLLILPDNWNDSIFFLTHTNEIYASSNSNIISIEQLNNLELTGCVFLPCTGFRDWIQGQVTYNNQNDVIQYWTSERSEYLNHPNNAIAVVNVQLLEFSRSVGFAVRLARTTVY